MSYVEKLYQLYDEATDSWLDVYKAACVGGGTVEVAVSRADRSVNAVRRVFLSKGVDDTVSDIAIEAAIGMNAPCVIRSARAGWRDADGAFVSPLQVSIACTQGPRILPPVVNRFTANLCKKGTLEDWQTVATIARHSTSCLVALGAAFGAPLIKLYGRSSFSIMIHGPSRCGKTTALLLAASAIGYSQKNKMFSCNGTEAGNLAAAHTLSDHMIPMDEAGTTQGSKRDTYAQIHNASYALCSGRDRTRHPSFKDEAIDATFNTIVLFTSEHSPDVWAARDGEARDEGECARLIGMPAVFGDSQTIFDRPPQHLKGQDLRAWERDQFRLINECASVNCGSAFLAFVDRLVGYPAEAAHYLREATNLFIKTTSVPSMSPVANDVVASFALIYAGLDLAIRAKILRFTFEDAFRGIQSAALAAVKALPDRQADLRHGLTILKSELEGGSIIANGDFLGRHQSALRQADGFFESDQRRRKYVVRAEVFRGWLSSLLLLNDVLHWLAREGFLMSKKVGHGASMAWAESQVYWPDKTRPRSIVLILPNGLDDLMIE